MFGILEKIFRRAGLNDFTLVHDHHFFGKREGLHLVVRHVNQRQFKLLVDLFELAPQMPFEMRINDGQRFVKEDGRDVAADQAAPQGYLLFGVRGQPVRFLFEERGELKNLGNFLHPAVDGLFFQAAILQREGEIPYTVIVSYKTGN